MSNEKPFETFRLATRFRVPDYMKAMYAHHMLMQPVEHEIMISFFQYQAPIIGGTHTEVEQQIAAVREKGFVDADCVARILIAKDKLPEFARTFYEFARDYMREEQAENAGGDGDSASEGVQNAEG